jgi:hypothetical protein
MDLCAFLKMGFSGMSKQDLCGFAKKRAPPENRAAPKREEKYVFPYDRIYKAECARL